MEIAQKRRRKKNERLPNHLHNLKFSNSFRQKLLSKKKCLETIENPPLDSESSRNLGRSPSNHSAFIPLRRLTLVPRPATVFTLQLKFPRGWLQRLTMASTPVDDAYLSALAHRFTLAASTREGATTQLEPVGWRLICLCWQLARVHQSAGDFSIGRPKMRRIVTRRASLVIRRTNGFPSRHRLIP